MSQVIPGWRHVYSGKVRDLYAPEGGGRWDPDRHVLVVASDRISAFDYVLPTEIPDKGKVLTFLTLWWLDQLGEMTANHLVSLDVQPVVAGRAMVCSRLEMLPVECVVRGYLTGSGLEDYRRSGQICGVKLPPGLTEASHLPEPIFTPAAKAQVGEHDQNVSIAQVAEMVGLRRADELQQLSLEIYRHAAGVAQQRGILLADTKFEFGVLPGGETLVLADEVLTPDSSRFWEADRWQEGCVTPSFDKQFVRDWLTGPESGWDRTADRVPPPLPELVVQATRQRYLSALQQLTGKTLGQWEADLAAGKLKCS